MKTIASLAIAALTLTAIPAAQAHDNKCGNHNNFIGGGYGVSFAPRYVSTRELYRTVQTQWGYDNYGNAYPYNVLVITYADLYSNGTSRTYTRSYRV